MSRSIRLYLEDILTSGEKILNYTAGMTFDEFIADTRTFDAVARNLQIIGEAVKNIPSEIRDRYPAIEWRKIAGLRDFLAHAYFSIENEILWDVVQTKISPLLAQVEQILQDSFEE
ncbi:MAG: DUF86 domain-containing protein [Cyanobacteria bacterium SBLK]|nr:DUF86 domain-containing protein [Cyanobacteria bacterium SBLK]